MRDIPAPLIQLRGFATGLMLTILTSVVAKAEETAILSDVVDAPRTAQGERYDGIVRIEPIYPWNDDALQSGMAEMIAKLETQGLPQHYIDQANDETLYDDPEGPIRYFQRSQQGIGMVFDGTTDEERDAGLLMLLKSAQADDARAFYNLANFFHISPEHAPYAGAEVDFWRAGADREFLPSIVNFLYYRQRSRDDEDLMEAYFRHGFDLDVPGGRYQISVNLLNFYQYDNRDRPAKGYANRAIAYLEEIGERAEATYQRAGVAYAGSEGEPDYATALKGYESLLAHPDRSYQYWSIVGHMHTQGRGTRADPDLGRDIFVACLKAIQESTCALNLGAYFKRPSQGFYDPVMSFLFYEFSVQLAQAEGYRTNVRIAERELEQIKRDLTRADDQKLDLYRPLIRELRFDEIPELLDVRPYTPPPWNG